MSKADLKTHIQPHDKEQSSQAYRAFNPSLKSNTERYFILKYYEL